MSNKVRVTYDYHSDPKLKRTAFPEITQDVSDRLERIAKKFVCGNLGFVEDLYSLLKSRGRSVMGRQRAKKVVDKLAKNGMKWGKAFKMIMKTRAFFNKMMRLPYFNKLADHPDTFEGVERLMGIFAQLSMKSQPGRCQSCALIKTCQFGKQFAGKDTKEIEDMGDPNYDKEHNEDCAEPPTNDPLAHAIKALALLFVIADPIQGAALQAMAEKTGKHKLAQIIMQLRQLNAVGKPTDEFDATFSGSNMFNMLERMVKDLTQQQLAVFELARTFNETLLPSGEDEKEEVEYVAHDQKSRTMRDIEEVQKAYPAEMVDDDLMDKKLALDQLQVRQDLERRKKKQFFELLVDVSGSMSDPISPNVYAMHNKGSFAAALCLSVIKKIGLEKGLALFRFFAGAPDDLHKGYDADSLADIARLVGLSDFNGGGTDIMSAIETACNDIREAEKIGGKGKAEILLISDGESHMDIPQLEKLLGKDIALHVLDVSPMNHRSHGELPLKQLSKTYFKVNPDEISFKDVANSAVGN